MTAPMAKAAGRVHHRWLVATAPTVRMIRPKPHETQRRVTQRGRGSPSSSAAGSRRSGMNRGSHASAQCRMAQSGTLLAVCHTGGACGSLIGMRRYAEFMAMTDEELI